MGYELRMAATSIPKVLFLGNGILRLAGGGNWSDLLRKIGTLPHKDRNLTYVPFAMQPEAICGVDVEEVQRRTAAAIKDTQEDPQDTLRRMLSLPFDAILTTNYTYEIENALTGEEWTERARRKAFAALDGNSRVRHNTKAEREQVAAEIRQRGIRRHEFERFIDELKKLPEAVSEFDEALWGSLVEYVTVGKDKTMVFTLLGGTEITA